MLRFVGMKIFPLVLLLVLFACRKMDDDIGAQISIYQPVAGHSFENDTLHFTIGLNTRTAGLLKMSLVNENGISILNPLIFEGIDRDTIISGFFLAEGLNYTGQSTLVALWHSNGVQLKKSVRILISHTVSYSDAFLLMSNQSDGLRLLQLMPDGSIRLDRHLPGVRAAEAVWSTPAQTMALLSHDRKSIIGMMYPFQNVTFTLFATANPFSVSFVRSEGSQFWIGEHSGNVRAIRAVDGSTLLTINGNPDSVPYTLSHCGQFTAVAYQSGGNKHSVKIFYRATGALHSVWPLNGRVVDALWKSEHQLNIAERTGGVIKLNEISVYPPTIRLLHEFDAAVQDSVFFMPDDTYLLSSGTSIYRFKPDGRLLWQTPLPGKPLYFALKPDGFWLHYSQHLIEFNMAGLQGRVVPLPGLTHKAIFAPIKSSNE
ncbi:MAG TPA: hypothetical protein PKE03_04795 [Bacteroidales bacterium]|nr:hypothetical protein [Bacteroidales bacterium]